MGAKFPQPPPTPEQLAAMGGKPHPSPPPPRPPRTGAWPTSGSPMSDRAHRILNALEATGHKIRLNEREFTDFAHTVQNEIDVVLRERTIP